MFLALLGFAVSLALFRNVDLKLYVNNNPSINNTCVNTPFLQSSLVLSDAGRIKGSAHKRIGRAAEKIGLQILAVKILTNQRTATKITGEGENWLKIFSPFVIARGRLQSSSRDKRHQQRIIILQ